MSLAEMNPEWSDALKASTREAIETLDLMPSREGRVAFKHVGGGFASIDMRDLLGGVLRVVDRRTGGWRRMTGALANVRAELEARFGPVELGGVSEEHLH